MAGDRFNYGWNDNQGKGVETTELPTRPSYCSECVYGRDFGICRNLVICANGLREGRAHEPWKGGSA